jgi:hypothetical protein
VNRTMGAGKYSLPGLHSASELDHVFWHFFTKFQVLPTPRSVAEARVSAHEVEFLTGWLVERGAWARHWCERTWQDKIEGDFTASDREMFGALFLIFASEVIRDQCNEESMWPAISKRLRGNKSAYTVLFDANGQPSANCKDAIAAGARKLDLRNLIDRYGKQEYFDTLKLQIGFTFKGATNRPGAPIWKGRDRLACLLGRPITQVSTISCAGAPFWEPALVNAQPQRSFRLSLESLPGEVVEIEMAAHIQVKGVPEDALEVSLLTDSIRHPVIRIGTTWRTQQPIKITLGIATGNTRIWVLIKGSNFNRTIPPKLSLNLRGIAAVETDGQDHTDIQWKLLSKHRPLNRAAGIGKARIFAPAGTAEICEGPCSVTKRTSRAIELRELHGWGYPLITRPQENGEPTTLACSVEDHGCVDLFLGTMGHKSFNTLYRRTPQVPSNDHSVVVWSTLHNAPRVISKNSIRSDPQGFAWSLPEIGQVAALAVAYQGCCLGSCWNSSLISSGLNQTRSTEGFALIRWLRIPVLNHTFRPYIRQAVSRAPVEFVSGWLGKGALPPGLGQRLAEQGIETVIRAFIWDHAERNESRMNLLVRAFPRSLAEGEVENEADQFKRTLVHVGGICPSVAYGFAKLRVRGEKYRKLVRTAAAEMLRQTTNELQQLHAALGRLRRDCAGLIGLTQDELQGALESYRRCLDGQVSEKRYEEHLRRLGEMVQGRQFLSAYLLMRLLDGMTP